uniref:Rhodopsin domain-containing protein n=1 Tax=Bionectria ochroleuca TaxID=29856 RepID=A0A8H7N5M0_BIOOC
MTTIDGVRMVVPAPEGYVVDLNNPERTGVPSVYYVAGFMGSLSLIFFAQRMYVKAVVATGIELDDVFLILAVLTVFATSGFTLHMFSTAIGGVHLWEVSMDNFHRYMLDVYIASILYPICGAFAKLSLLVFYLRLSPQTCFDIRMHPDQNELGSRSYGGHCINRPAVYMMIAVTNIVSDIVLFVLPLPMVISLHIPVRQKIGLAFIFGIGSLTIITSVVRLSILKGMLTDPDVTWVVGNASIWTQVEGYMMIMCASLPTLRRFFKHVAPKLLGTSRYGTKTKTNENTHPPSRTFIPKSQSRRDRTQYSQFDAEEGGIATDTYIMGAVKGTSNNTITAGEPGDTGGWGDTDSEKAMVAGGSPKVAILQTTVVTVDVEYAEDNQEGGSKHNNKPGSR